MCLAIPGRLVAINGDTGDVDFGGTIKQTNTVMVNHIREKYTHI